MLGKMKMNVIVLRPNVRDDYVITRKRAYRSCAVSSVTKTFSTARQPVRYGSEVTEACIRASNEENVRTNDRR
jgi:hypothetical protein